MRLDAIGAMLVVATGFCLLLLRRELALHASSLALVYALQMPHLLKWVYLMGAEAAAHMASVQRALAFTKLRQEAEETMETDGIVRVRGWPHSGRVTFASVVMRFRLEAPPVLRGVSLELDGGSKLAVVGRAGSGRSSLAAALLRLAELEGGQLLIDGVDIASIGTRLLRHYVSFVGREPILFGGSLRWNLDPARVHSDDELERALNQIGFSRHLREGGLEMNISAGGADLPPGARQLLALVRALLRRAAVVIVDEVATPQDESADATAQRLVRRHFDASTLIRIVRRLGTMIDIERVAVMVGGRVAECAAPATLLADPATHFSALVDATGPDSARRLRASAIDAEKERRRKAERAA